VYTWGVNKTPDSICSENSVGRMRDGTD